MKKISVLLFSFLMAILAFGKDYTEELNYEIEGAGVGAQGTYLVNVTVISKNPKVEDELIDRCAVHGVLFRGFSQEKTHRSQKPLAGSALIEQQYPDFFKEFFKKGGTAKNYVTAGTSARKVVKSGKQYRVSKVVTVNKEQLLKDLQNAGIVKSLNSGF